MEKNMKKYRTFGELLTFIREHLDECEQEDVSFAVVLDGVEKVDPVYLSPLCLLNTLYQIPITNGLVVSVEETRKEFFSSYVLIKVLT